MSEDTINGHHINLVRSLYTESLKLLKDKSAGSNSADTEKYKSLRFELQKLGFASIYNFKNYTHEGHKIEDSVIDYMQRRFQHLNNSILAAYDAKEPKKGFMDEIRDHLTKRNFYFPRLMALPKA